MVVCGVTAVKSVVASDGVVVVVCVLVIVVVVGAVVLEALVVIAFVVHGYVAPKTPTTTTLRDIHITQNIRKEGL